MTVRDSITRTGARTPGAEDYPTSMAAHGRASLPTQCGIIEVASTCAKDRHKPHISRCMPGAGLSRPSVGRCCPTCQPSSRIGENPPYGMIGGIEETSASFEARSAPRSYPALGVPSREYTCSGLLLAPTGGRSGSALCPLWEGAADIAGDARPPPLTRPIRDIANETVLAPLISLVFV